MLKHNFDSTFERWYFHLPAKSIFAEELKGDSPGPGISRILEGEIKVQ